MKYKLNIFVNFSADQFCRGLKIRSQKSVFKTLKHIKKTSREFSGGETFKTEEPFRTEKGLQEIIKFVNRLSQTK